MHRDGILLSYTWDSVYRVMVGWSWPWQRPLLGLFIATSGRPCAPLIEFARYLPVVALVPLTPLCFGIGDGQKFAIIFLGTFFQLTLMVADVAALARGATGTAGTAGRSAEAALLPGRLTEHREQILQVGGIAGVGLAAAPAVLAVGGTGPARTEARIGLRATLTEEVGEDVLEAGSTRAPGAACGEAGRRSASRGSRRTAGAPSIRQDGIRLADLLEALLGRRVPRLAVGVVRAGELAIRLLDGVGVSGGRDAERGVEVLRTSLDRPLLLLR